MNQQFDFKALEHCVETFNENAKFIALVIVAGTIIKEVEDSWEVFVSKLETYQ